MSKEVIVEVTFKGDIAIEVPDDWEWDGTLQSLVEWDDLSASSPGLELVDWEVRR